MDLASLLNSPCDIEYEGVTYKFREPNLLECAEYARELEREARAGAARATELSDEDRRMLLRDVQRDIVAGTYGWGGVVCIESLRTPDGLARLLAITGREQKVTPKLAREIVEHRMKEIAAVLLAAHVGDDPEQKKNLAAVCLNLGLPPDFLSTSSSDSAPTHSEAPKISSPSVG